MEELNENNQSPFSKKLNFILALCAMLISIASFYATYIQAVSSEQQVKAMTYPLVQFSHGNFDVKNKEQKIYFKIKNAGVGPAMVKKIEYEFENKKFTNSRSFLKGCCNDELKAVEQPESGKEIGIESQVISSSVTGNVLAAGNEIDVLQLVRHKDNLSLWNKLNRDRFSVNVSICYCSLLDNCYWKESGKEIREVNTCN